ncbi:MAG TPA: type II toxin-antitoxin system RelE/ParE family toxin [Armatimonadota bacterium]|nr:type II toxin-antitoxin system RelE/ParE family toxin [Armatimonadota bacterium]
MTTYSVQLTDQADMEVEHIYMWHSQRSPELAHRWYTGLLAALDSLSTMPQRRAVAREDDAFQGVTVRQLLYGKYRILFHVVEPEEGEEGVVRVLHVAHGARRQPGKTAGDDESAV